jgi:hypothetical protein
MRELRILTPREGRAKVMAIRSCDHEKVSFANRNMWTTAVLTTERKTYASGINASGLGAPGQSRQHEKSDPNGDKQSIPNFC